MIDLRDTGLRSLPCRQILAALALSGALVAGPLAVPDDVGDTVRIGSDKQTISWGPVPGATSYNVYRGSTPAVHDHVCLVVHRTLATAGDAATPSAGGLFYYLVSAVDGSGEGTLGTDSSGNPRPNASPCADLDGDLVPDNLDDCPSASNPSQADQNLDGIGDACDPRTYDFESDTIGQRPAGATETGGSEPSFVVRDYAGDKGVAYSDGVGGVQDVLDRLRADEPFQPATVYLDFDAAPQVLSIELWSDGAFSWNAGYGLIFQIGTGGQCFLYQRLGQSVPVQSGPASALPNGRARLRLVPGAGGTAKLHVDSFDGSTFVDDFFVFDIADTHRFFGLETATANYLGGKRGLTRITVEHPASSLPLHLRKHFSWSSDYKLFQRDVSGAATIPLRFTYTSLSAARIEARVVQTGSGATLPGHDYADHALPVAPGSGASGSLAIAGVPAGGDYDVQTRLVRVSDSAILGTDSLDHVAVGDVFLSGGQSNMSGYSGSLDNAETPIEQAHLFGNDYVWRQAVEPMDSGVEQVDLVSAESPQHSLMLPFAKNTYLGTGVPVGIIVGPLGGTNLYSQWQRNESIHDDRSTLYGSLLHRGLAQGYASPIKGFLWYQGESDAGRGTVPYLSNLQQLVGEYRADLANSGLYFLNVQLATSFQQAFVPWLEIKEAQRQQAAADPRSALSIPVDQPRNDTIHLNVQGYKTLGARMALWARKLIYGQPVDPGATLTAVRFKDTQHRDIDVVWDQAVKNGAAALFRVFDDLQQVSISSMSISGSTLTLHLASRINGAGQVSYGYSQNPASSWVLSAASGIPVANFNLVAVTGP